MTTTAINYRDLCAYIDANAHRLPAIRDSILASWGELEAPCFDAVEQAEIEAVDELVEEFCEKLGFFDGSALVLRPHICAGQPKDAPCWKARGWN